jgi:hypothetical protein
LDLHADVPGLFLYSFPLASAVDGPRILSAAAHWGFGRTSAPANYAQEVALLNDTWHATFAGQGLPVSQSGAQAASK